MPKHSAARTRPVRRPARLLDLDDRLKQSCKGATPSQIEELNAAKRSIAEKNLPSDFAIKSFDRAADAIKNGIRVFVSYKFIHHELAIAFRDLIRKYGQSRLARERGIFLAEQGVEAGKDYPTQIQDAIDKAHWFFLLLPDVQFGREWPIYEAGYFQRGMTASERLICIHHKTVAEAAQFQYLQACDSSPEGLQRLFTELFFGEHAIPGMKQIASNDFNKYLSKDTEDLSNRFQPVAFAEVCGRFIDLEHKDGIVYDKMEDLLSTRILGMKNLKEAFGREDTFRGNFGELIASVNDKDHGQQWLDALLHALQDIVGRYAPRAVEVPFLGFKRGWAFRPNLFCVWKNEENKKIERFQVVFTEQIEARVANASEKLNALETALRWAYRGWWEIYGTYNRKLTVQDVEDIYRYTQRAEQEVQSRGVMDPEIMLEAFKDQEKTILRKNLVKYLTDYRNPQTNNGKLDKAFRDRDPKLMKDCLDELKPDSAWFLKVAAKRFAELIDEEIQLPAAQKKAE